LQCACPPRAESLTRPCCSHLNHLVQERWSATAQAGDTSSNPSPMQNSSKEIRRTIRQRRRALPDQQQRAHSLSAARHFFTSPLASRSRIALYLANDGELDLQPLMQGLLACSKRIHLPVLRPESRNRLWFAEYRAGDRLIPNRFGILEPDIRKRRPIPPWGLDLVLLPLVAFDDAGNRIGMGGGFYDRTFAYQTRHDHWIRPRLVGVAHECQRIDRIERNTWDIPLSGIITEQGYRRF
jgi:5-formyltetrahydrofolate cyclo-ligase